MDKLVYEATVVRPDGTRGRIEILECDTETEAIERASHCAKKWLSPVRLYQVPYVDDSPEAWLNDEIHFVVQLGPWPTHTYRTGKRS